MSDAWIPDDVVALCARAFEAELPGLGFVAKAWIEQGEEVLVEVRVENHGGSWLLEYLNVPVKPPTPSATLRTLLTALRRALYEQSDYARKHAHWDNSPARKFDHVGFGPTPDDGRPT
jgi:hypothetical protein